MDFQARPILPLPFRRYSFFSELLSIEIRSLKFRSEDFLSYQNIIVNSGIQENLEKHVSIIFKLLEAFLPFDPYRIQNRFP